MILGFTQKINKKPNYFVQKIWNGILVSNFPKNKYIFNEFNHLHFNKLGVYFQFNKHPVKPKIHTIRAGNRWRAGMIIDFFINTRTKLMFRFAPKIPCKSVQEIQIKWLREKTVKILIENKLVLMGDFRLIIKLDWLIDLAINDGFDSAEDFLAYFSKDFTGQIIHWTDKKY